MAFNTPRHMKYATLRALCEAGFPQPNVHEDAYEGRYVAEASSGPNSVRVYEPTLHELREHLAHIFLRYRGVTVRRFLFDTKHRNWKVCANVDNGVAGFGHTWEEALGQLLLIVLPKKESTRTNVVSLRRSS